MIVDVPAAAEDRKFHWLGDCAVAGGALPNLWLPVRQVGAAEARRCLRVEAPVVAAVTSVRLVSNWQTVAGEVNEVDSSRNCSSLRKRRQLQQRRTVVAGTRCATRLRKPE